MDWYLDGAEQVGELRRELADYLLRHAVPGSEDDVLDAELVVSEAVGNAIRHTEGPVWVSLDWVAEHDGQMVASALVWLDEQTGSALVEPVGTHPDHRGRGLAAAVNIAGLTAARDLGGTHGLVIPRGDDDYPAPGRVYRSIGFRPGPRTVRLSSPTVQ